DRRDLAVESPVRDHPVPLLQVVDERLERLLALAHRHHHQEVEDGEDGDHRHEGEPGALGCRAARLEGGDEDDAVAHRYPYPRHPGWLDILFKLVVPLGENNGWRSVLPIPLANRAL